MALQSSRVLVSFWMCQSIPITSNHRYFEACLEWGSSRNYVHFIGNMMKIPWGFWEYPILGSHIYLAGVKYYRSNDPSYGDVGGHELQREIDRWYNLEDGGFLQPTMWFFFPPWKFSASWKGKNLVVFMTKHGIRGYPTSRRLPHCVLGWNYLYLGDVGG